MDYVARFGLLMMLLFLAEAPRDKKNHIMEQTNSHEPFAERFLLSDVYPRRQMYYLHSERSPKTCHNMFSDLEICYSVEKWLYSPLLNHSPATGPPPVYLVVRPNRFKQWFVSSFFAQFISSHLIPTALAHEQPCIFFWNFLRTAYYILLTLLYTLHIGISILNHATCRVTHCWFYYIINYSFICYICQNEVYSQFIHNFSSYLLWFTGEGRRGRLLTRGLKEE